MRITRHFLMAVITLFFLILTVNRIATAQRPGPKGEPFILATPTPSLGQDPDFRRAAERVIQQHLENGEIALSRIAVSPSASIWQTGPLGGRWQQWISQDFGYMLEYPPNLIPEERASRSQAMQTGVPSNVWFGEHIQLIVRMPPVDEETFERWTGEWEIVSADEHQRVRRMQTVVTSPWSGEQFLTTLHIVHTPQADYLLSLNAPLAQTSLRDIFEQMVRSFRVTGPPEFRVASSSAIIATAVTDGFDFPVDPKDGSSDRPPWYASYNVQNPAVPGWSNCYGKPLSQLQHAGEDWFRAAGSNVYAVANGRVIWAQNHNWPGAVVIIEHTLPNGVTPPWGGNLIYSFYGHLDPSSLPAQWSDVQRGQWIGRVYNWGLNSHVHFELRRYGNMGQAPGNVNGYFFCNTAGWPGPGYTDTNANPDWFGYTNPSLWIDGHRPGGGGVTCPNSGGVILYQHANYDCGNQGEGIGYVIRNSTGFQNVPGTFNDKASSIRIPSGWSVRLYEHSDRGGGKRCINAPGDNDFSGDTFDNSVPLNDKVSSFEVFATSNCAGGSPPDTTPPSGDYSSPSNGATVGRTVRLAAWASDNQSGVREVHFTAKWSGQWRLVHNDTSAPYEYDWDLCASGVPDGDIELGLDIWDNAGNEFHLHTVHPNPHITKSYNCSPPSNTWSVDYWNNKSLAGSPNWHNNESGTYIFRDWGDGSPGGGIQVNEWSARFVRTVYFPGGDYRFHCQHDDGCRIYIDGQERLNAWWDSSFDGHDWGGYLSPGNHEVKVEYYENQGGARLEVWWQGPGFLPRDQTCDPNQWCAEYRGNRNLAGPPAILRNEGESLWHEWGSGGPDPTFPTDNFSSRFYRNASFTCGTYRFHIFTDDGVRFWVDDVLRLDQWRDQVASYNVDVSLSSGSHFLKVEHYENGGSAAIRLWWEKLADCQPNVTVEYASTHYARPGSTVSPAVRVRVTAGYLQGSREDSLILVGGSSLGAASSQPVYGTVNEGSTYTFDVANNSSFRMTAPSGEGTYDSRWRVKAAGNLIGPEATVRVVVDDTPPTIAVQNPAQSAFISANTVTIQATPQDSNGIDQVQFFVGYDNGSGWAWYNLGWDLNGSNGWSKEWDASGVPDQRGVAFFAYAWDRAGNYAGAAVWDVTLDRTPPTTAIRPLAATQDSTAFIVWWDGSDNAAGIDHFDLQERQDGGAWKDWHLGVGSQYVGAWFIGEMGHRYDFRMRGVDRAGNAEPYPGGAEAGTYIHICSGDTYEADNEAGQARSIAPGQSQAHNFCGVSDEDWVKFRARAGQRYVLETGNLGFTTDTVLTLYDADGTTVLAENDDIAYPGNLASRVEWIAPQDRWLYARVRQWDGRVAGNAVTYTLRLEEGYRIYLPLTLRR